MYDQLNAAGGLDAKGMSARKELDEYTRDGGDRYRSRLYNDAWLAENDLVPRAEGLAFL